MAEAATSLDGAIVGGLLGVIERFADQLIDEDTVRASLSAHGVGGAEADAAWNHLAAHAADLGRLRGDLPGLLTNLRSSSPDPAALVQPVADLWQVVTGLADGAPTLALPNAPGAGSFLDIALGASIEATLAERSPNAWAFARAIQVVGPDLPVLDALDGILDGAVAFIWSRFVTTRRNLDITIAGLVSGPRTTSIVTVPADDDRFVAPEVLAKLPTAAQVVGRVTFRLAADTYDDPVPVFVELIGDAAVPPGIVAAVARTPPWLDDIALSSHLRLSLDPLTHPLGIALTPDGHVVPLADGQPGIAIRSTFETAFAFGPPGGLRVELGEPIVEVHADLDGWGIRFGAGRFEITIPGTILGPVVALLLPRDGIHLRGKLIVLADGGGVRLDGGVGLVATWPDTIRLPGLVVHSLTTAITVDGPSLSVAASGTIVVELGPLTVTVEGLGLDQAVAFTSDGSGNLGLLDLGEPRLKAPTGFGVHVDAAIIKGGGFLRVQGDEISGALELALALGSVEIEIRAVGVIGNVDGRVSFIVVMSIEFAPPIELFLGLTLNAVGGVFGLNRTLDPAALTELVRSGRMSDLMFPDDIGTRAIEIIGSVKQVFPAKADQYVIGPMLKLGWGRPVSFVTVEVGLVLTFPTPTIIAMIGRLHLALPADDLALIELNAGFAGTIDVGSGDVRFDASLERSTIGLFEVSGDICLRAGPTGFVFSAGGFHPRFTPPASVGTVRRLAIAISPSPILSIRADAYFAVTASTLQFGAGLYMEAELGPLGARGHLNLDVLIRTEPKLAFLAEIAGHFALTFEGEEIVSASLDVLLEGPGRWHARAHASIELLFIEVSGTLELSWGEDSGSLPPPVDVADRVRLALQADHVWAHVLPAADAGVIQLRAGAEGLHPLGSLRITQTVAPLEVPIARYGGAPVVSGDPVTVAIVAPGIGEPAPADELFAPAQFFTMTDDEKLGKPAFVPYPAGSTLRGDAWQPVADPLTVDIVYEESTGETRDPLGSRFLGVLEAGLVGWAITGAAGRRRSGDVTVRLRDVAVRDLGVREPAYAVADAATGAAAGGLAERHVLDASMRVSADRVVLADYELAGLR